jgi:hypothetical protein
MSQHVVTRRRRINASKSGCKQVKWYRDALIVRKDPRRATSGGQRLGTRFASARVQFITVDHDRLKRRDLFTRRDLAGLWRPLLHAHFLIFSTFSSSVGLDQLVILLLQEQAY